MSVSLSASLADPQSAKQTNVTLTKEGNGQPNETNKWITQRNILRGKSESITYRIGRATKNLSANGQISLTGQKPIRHFAQDSLA